MVSDGDAESIVPNVVLQDEPNNNSRPRREPIRWFDTTWKKWTWGLSICTLLLVIIILLATSLKKLKSTEYGVQYTPYTKKLEDSARTGGE